MFCIDESESATPTDTTDTTTTTTTTTNKDARLQSFGSIGAEADDEGTLNEETSVGEVVKKKKRNRKKKTGNADADQNGLG